MPEVCAPVVSEVEAINYKHGGAAISLEEVEKYDCSGSERSCSPKSESSGCSESCDSVTDSDGGSCQTWAEECEAEDKQECDDITDGVSKLNMSEEELTAMVTIGADVRHVVQSSWKLKGKDNPVKKKTTNRSIPGQALRDMAQAQKEAMELHEKRKSVKPPPGFEQMYGASAMSESTREPILVAYADGNSTLTLSAEPLCLHNITVASTVDSGHIFIKQMNNPTHAGLAPLEEAMLEAYMEDGPELFRPIATGSLLAVKSDTKIYRCQVVYYNEETDSCDIKFVDHGGYTTVPVQDLRQLRQDFIRLPFQAIEVYLAHVSPATDDVIIDIVSDILFRNEVTIHMAGYAEDNVPVVQAFFYVNDYVHLLTQDTIEEAYTLFKKEFPDYTPVPVTALAPLQLELAESEVSAEDAECAAYSDFSDEGICSGVSSTESEPRTAVQTPAAGEEEREYSPVEPCVPVSPVPSSYSDAEVPAVIPLAYPVCGGEPMIAHTLPSGEIAYMPMYTYCVQDPNTGLLYYIASPVMAAPVVEFDGESAALAQDEVSEETSVKPIEEWTQEDYEAFYNQE
jgi:hypothetical protein